MSTPKPHGHGDNTFAIEPTLHNAKKNGGYLRSRIISLADFYATTANTLQGPGWSTQAGSGVAAVPAYAVAGNGRSIAYTFASSATATVAADIHIPEEFNRDSAIFRVQMLALSSLATLTSLSLTPTIRFHRWGAAVKTAIGTTATRRWNTPPVATTYNDDIGAASATGTTTLAIPTNASYANAPTRPMLLEFDFTPGATTARTNYPEPGDVGHFRLLATANTTDGTDTFTILQCRVIENVHAGFFREPERHRV